MAATFAAYNDKLVQLLPTSGRMSELLTLCQDRTGHYYPGSLYYII